MKAPIRYFGGKGNMLKTLLSHFPPAGSYTTFVDAYGGSGIVLLNKPDCPVEIYNDLDANVYALYTVLQDPAHFAIFQQKADLAIFQERLSIEYEQSLAVDELDLVERAFRFWYVNRTIRGGSGGLAINGAIRRKMGKSASDFLAAVERMPDLHQRLSKVIVLNRDAVKLVGDWDRAGVLAYADPPYIWATRGGTRYAVDADDNHHRALVKMLLSLKQARVMLSGYDHTLYDPLVDAGWRKVEFRVYVVDSKNQPKARSEWLWMNYPAAPQTLPLPGFGFEESEA